jgi:hypothetical protein
MDANTTPTIGKLEVNTPSTDPTMALVNRGLLGGNGNDGGLLMLLLLSMFSRGGFGYGSGGDPVAAASITTSKDVSQQLTTFQSWASNNAATIQQAICGIDKSICQSSAQITAAVNALTPQMFQQFSAQAAQMNAGFQSLAMQLCQCCNQMERGVSAGFAQLNENLHDGISVLESKQDAFAAAQALAICQTQNQIAAGNAALANQLNLQTCEIKTAIIADGAATRALIAQNETARIREELTDAKVALSNCQQTGNFSTILNAQLQNFMTRCCPQANA